MVTGHVGVASLARRWRSDAPITALLIAALAPDLVDLGYALVGFDPPCGLYSHSLPAAAVLLVIALTAARAARLSWGATAALLTALLLHFATDYITGQKLLWAGGPVTSLILYDRPLLDLAMELPIVVVGWWLIRNDAGVPRIVRGRLALATLMLAQVTFDGLKIGQPLTPPGACALPRSERLRRSFGHGTPGAKPDAAFDPLDASRGPVLHLS